MVNYFRIGSFLFNHSNATKTPKVSGIEQLDFHNYKERKFFELSKNYESFEDSWFALIQGIRRQ